VRRTAVLVALVAALAGCGGDDDERREAYEDYIEAANEAQAEFAPGFRRAQAALRTFASGRAGERTATRLRDAAAVVSGARASLALVEPPADARVLHRDLLKLLDLQASLARELSLAAEYVPQVEQALEAPQTAAATLRRALGNATDAPEQSVALRIYADELEEALNALDSLAPPPVLQPWHAAQADRVEASRKLALELADAIDAGSRAGVQEALDAFANAAGNPRAANRAQAEAVKVFNRRLDQQQRLLQRIAREEFRIAGELQ
jgi:hypothetical protein